MAKLPILQEFGTSCMIIGDLTTGNPKKAEQRWDNYCEESVIGSSAALVGCVANNVSKKYVEGLEKVTKQVVLGGDMTGFLGAPTAGEALEHGVQCLIGDDGEVEKYAKGLGRATGQAVLGGGLLENIPVFHELSTAGKALGNLMGGDEGSVKKGLGDYVENSVIGSTVGSVVEAVSGNEKRANELINNAGKATLSAGVTAGSIALTVMTGGLAAPLGTVASVVAGATVGASTSVISAGVDQQLYGDGEVDTGALVGSAIVGGTMGAFNGYKQAEAYQQSVQNKMDGEMLDKASNEVKETVKEHKDEFSSRKAQQEKVVHTKMVSEDGREGSGYNNKARSRINGAIKDPETGKMVPSGNIKGGPAYPNGTPNMDEIAKKSSVQKALAKTGENRPLHNCAEPHALENLKADHPNAAPKTNYTVAYQHDGSTVVKAPCENCSAMSPGYGEVPFAKYDGVRCENAIASHINEGTQAVKNAVVIGSVASSGATSISTKLGAEEMPLEFVVFTEGTVPEYIFNKCKEFFPFAKELIHGSVRTLRNYLGIDGVIRIAMGNFDQDAASEFLREIGSSMAVVLVQLDCSDYNRIRSYITNTARTPSHIVYGVCQGKVTKNEAVCRHALSCLKDLCCEGRNSYRRQRLLKEPAVLLE